ncbi:DUF397 domain-containing protein [Streptomyces sp. NPDC002092]
MSATELHWFKSSYSSSNESGDCVEVALDWFKSSYSDSSDINDCVEVANTATVIHIRDSKAPENLHLTVAPTTWTTFLSHVSTR